MVCALSCSSDTQVATPDGGQQAIGTLKVGDQVTAYDPSTGKSSTQTVQHVWINHDHDLLDVTLRQDGQDGYATQTDASDKTQQVATKAHGSQAPPAGNADETTSETLHTTAKHPWLTTDRGWVAAGKLRAGEQVRQLDGRTATVAAVRIVPGAATMYDLTVSQAHTFAVGTGLYIVHNTGDGACEFVARRLADDDVLSNGLTAKAFRDAAKPKRDHDSGGVGALVMAVILHR